MWLVLLVNPGCNHLRDDYSRYGFGCMGLTKDEIMFKLTKAEYKVKYSLNLWDDDIVSSDTINFESNFGKYNY